MQIKVDEDLPGAVVEVLKAAGHEASGVREQGMSGWKDAALWRAVQSEGRFLVTADKGFADVRSHPPGSHAGILLLRPDKESILAMVDLVERVLTVCKLEELASKVTVVTGRGLRIRRN